MHDHLRAVLARYPASAQPTDEPEALGNAGGLSGSRLWRYRAGPRTLLARAWPPDGPPRAAIERIHGWLEAAGDLGFVPVPLPDREGRTLHAQGGRLWEVTPWMPGEPEPQRPPPPGRVRAAFAALAALHLRLASGAARGPSPGLRARLREAHDWLGGGFARVEALLSARPTDPHSGSVLRWVAGARSRAPRLAELLTRAAGVEVPLQPCLRDVRPEHVLFTGDAVTGLVDFGAMAVESVAGDLARLLSEWRLAHPADRARALDAYTSVRPLDPEEIPLIDVFARSAAVLGGGHWVRWHVIEGRAFDDPQAIARGLQRALERMDAFG